MIRILIFLGIGIAFAVLYRLVRSALAPTFEFTMRARRMSHKGSFKHGFLKEVERILIDEDIRNAKVKGFGTGADTRLTITGDPGIELAAQRIRNTWQLLH